MFKKQILKFSIALSILIVGISTFLLFKKENKSQVKTVPTGIIQKQFATQLNNHLNSEVAKLWSKEDYSSLKERFSETKPAKGNILFFQISNYYHDIKKPTPSLSKITSYDELKSALVTFVTSKESGASPIAVQYAFKLMEKMTPFSKQQIETISSHYKKLANDSRKNQTFEFLVTSETPSNFITDEVLKQAKNDASLPSIFHYLTNSKSQEFQSKVSKYLIHSFESRTPAGQAQLLKFFAYNRKHAPQNLESWLAKISNRTDDISQDAFLHASQQLKLKTKYSDQIRKIASSSEFFNIRSMAASILAEKE